MAGFLGEYEATIDAKGRFLLPGALKKQMPEGNTNMVISRGIENCLFLYPIKTWEAIEAQISILNPFDKEANQFRTQLYRGASPVELDSAGRILLPPSLKSYAGLVKDITLASDMDKIKIWDSEKYKQLFEDFSSDDFAALAKKVMSGNSNA